jgi:hypothetical protein
MAGPVRTRWRWHSALGHRGLPTRFCPYRIAMRWGVRWRRWLAECRWWNRLKQCGVTGCPSCGRPAHGCASRENTWGSAPSLGAAWHPNFTFVSRRPHITQVMNGNRMHCLRKTQCVAGSNLTWRSTGRATAGVFGPAPGHFVHFPAPGQSRLPRHAG